MIDFFSNQDLQALLEIIQTNVLKDPHEALNKFASEKEVELGKPEFEVAPIDDRTEVEKEADDSDEDIYSVRNFTV